MDFSQFFNPSAWGSWAPPMFGQNMVPPQAQQAQQPPAQPPVQPPPGNAPQAAPGTPQSGGFGKNPNSALMNAAMGLLKPQAPPPQLPPIQMARPVGPVQLPGMLNQFGTGF